MDHVRNSRQAAALRIGACAIVLVAVAALVTSSVVSQEKEVDPAMEEMMAKWKAAGTPGPFHKHLDAFIGTWTAESKFWQNPNDPPEVSKAKSSNSWLMGGRFLQQNYKGLAMGQPFTGMGIMGYDNLKKQYISTWIDDMSTSIMTDAGTCDDSGKVFTMRGEGIDPMTGENKPYESILRVISKNKYSLEMFTTGPDGKKFRNMEIVYTRNS